jgi:uncharacterized membrane protein YidH (DUF202 family)
MDHYTNTSNAELKPFKLKNLFNQYLIIKKKKRNLLDVFLWWERKRIVFNLFILALCFISFEIQKLIPNSSSSEIFTKRELIIFIILYNIIYSSFCVVEFFLKKNRTYGPNTFKNGLFICTAVITIPTVFQIIERIILM